MENQKRAYIYAGLSVVLWSTVATAFKITLSQLSPIKLLLISSGTASFILILICFFKNKNLRLLKISIKDLIFLIILGFLNPFLYYIVLFSAYRLLPAQEALTLNYSWAIVLVLLSALLLKQKLSFKTIISLIIGFSGVIVIATRGDIFSLSFKSPLGVVLALLSSLIWALYWIFNQKSNLDINLKLAISFTSGFIFILILTLIFSENQILYNSNNLELSSNTEILSYLNYNSNYNLESIMGAVYIGLFEMGITFLFWLKALTYSKSTAQISTLVFLSPFLSLFFISFILGEAITTATIVGLILIISGIIIQKLWK